MKYLLPLLLILLTGCTTLPKYNYQSQASADPEIIFGDRFGEENVVRVFTINTKDAASNICTEFSMIGVTANSWMKLNPPTIQIKIPAGKLVSIHGTWRYANASCEPRTLMFLPKDAARYSVDIEAVSDTCRLSIVQKLPNGQQEKVEGITVLPDCKNK